MSDLTILVVVAHSDDETIGMGGTICRHVSRGDRVFVVSMTDGVGGRTGTVTDDIEKRKKSAKRASEILGFEWAEAYSFVDNAMDRVSLLEVVKSVEAVKSSLQPALIYTHSGADLNVDHKITNKAVVTACRPQNSSPVRMLLFFEILSSTEWNFSNENNYFKPNYFVNIAKTLDKKLAAMRAYKSELRRWPHPRSIDGIKTLSKYRGMSSGLDSAEAFVQAFKIDKDQHKNH